MRRTVSGILLTLLLVMLAFAFNIHPVKAIAIIYIRADGSIDPSSVPIQRDGGLYTLTGDITDYDGIVVERNNIILDGANHLFDGCERDFHNGITLEDRENVTIKNMIIKRFAWWCITLKSSSNNFILANDIASSSRYGGDLQLVSSSNNLISGNNITDSYQYYDGICLSSSSNSNSIIGNNIVDHDQSGVGLHSSSNNIISGNNITNNGYGISILGSSSNNRIYHNNVADNTQQCSSTNSTNIWDNGYPSGGNYWSDYTGVDANGDGIGDTPYIIDSDNRDNYPLVCPWNGSVAPSAHLSLQPQNYTMRFMRTFTVNATVANVTNLYGYDFKVHWNATLLDLVSVSVTPPVAWGSSYFVIRSNVSDSTYWHALSALAPAPAFNGSTTLGSLTFNVTYTSALQSLYNSTVETCVTLDETILADNSAHAIVHDTSNCRAQIRLVMMGDLNGDKAVNILDVVKVAIIYGQSGTPGWKSEDMDCDGHITIFDLVSVTVNYGKKV